MFCCVLRRSGRPLRTDPAVVTERLRRHHPGDVAGSVGTSHEDAFFATQTLLHATPESHGERVPAQDTAGRVLVSWLRIDNRDDLARELRWDAGRLTAATDADLVLAAYDHWGTECPDHLEGDFAFVVHDPARHGVFGARDAAGIKPFYFAETPDLFAAATAPSLLLPLAADGVDTSVRPEWVARFLHGVSMSWDETPFAGIRKLPPGHSVWADRDEVRVRRWHEFRDDAPWEDTRAEHWVDAYRERLHEAVRCRIRSEGPIGIETSGGIDSSTILALVAMLAPGRRRDIRAFGYMHAELEPEYILETSLQLRIPHTHVLTGIGEASVPSAGWEALGHPVEHANAVGHVPIYELARTFGARTLHSGHGGDEVVTNPGGLVLHELADRGAYRALLRDLPNRPHRRVPWILRERWRAGRPLTESALTGPLMARLAWTPLTPRAMADADVVDRTRTGALYSAPYRRVNDFALIGRLLPFVSTRTSEGSVVAASYGLDYRWALLDRRLMQQWLSTPAIWKYAAGTGRYLHRRAISGVVPDKVAWKPTKDMTLGDHEPPVQAAPDTDAALHPLLAELLDERRWREPADERGLPPANPLNLRPWRRAADINDWLTTRGPSGL